MYKNTKYWTVTESNVLSNDTVGVQNYVYMTKAEAESKLYRLWGYGANPESGETRQLLSAYMTEHTGDHIAILESKVLDYRQPEPAPEPEPEPENDLDTVLRQAVADGKITAEQYTEITGKPYESA